MSEPVKPGEDPRRKLNKKLPEKQEPRFKIKRKAPPDAEGIIKLEKNRFPPPGEYPRMKISTEQKLLWEGPMSLEVYRLLRYTYIAWAYYKIVKGELQILADAPPQKW